MKVTDMEKAMPDNHDLFFNSFLWKGIQHYRDIQHYGNLK